MNSGLCIPFFAVYGSLNWNFARKRIHVLEFTLNYLQLWFPFSEKTGLYVAISGTHYYIRFSK